MEEATYLDYIWMDKRIFKSLMEEATYLERDVGRQARVARFIFTLNLGSCICSPLVSSI